MSYLLDTNVLSETRKRNRNAGVTEWISTTGLERMHLSALTIGEIGQGITQLHERGDRRQAAVIESWLDDVVQGFGPRIVPVTLEIAREWGAQSKAQPVPVIDALIGRHRQGVRLDAGDPQCQGLRHHRGPGAQPVHRLTRRDVARRPVQVTIGTRQTAKAR